MRAAVLFPPGNSELFCCEKNSFRQPPQKEGNTMPLGTILLILLVLVSKYAQVLEEATDEPVTINMLSVFSEVWRTV
jgi:hypothetical protein